jgi:hypothetical protein
MYTSLYAWLVFAHVASVFAFLLAHGVSTGVAFKLRGERKVERVRALLDLSRGAIKWTYAFLVLVVATGGAAAVIGRWWGHLWIWAALALLIAVSLLMDWIGDPYYGRLRAAVGVVGAREAKQQRDDVASEEELEAMLRSPRPYLLAAIGGLGLAAILWLMVFKPL